MSVPEWDPSDADEGLSVAVLRADIERRELALLEDPFLAELMANILINVEVDP